MKYLGFKIIVNGEIEVEVKSWMNDVGKVLGCMKVMFSCRGLRMNTERRLYEGLAVSAPLYGPETWSMVVVEKRCLRSMYELSEI